MPTSKLEARATSQATKNAPESKPDAFAGVVGFAASWAFIGAASLGFFIGFALTRTAGSAFVGAVIAFGALAIAATVGRWALALQRKAEGLQQQVLDETSYRAFVESAIEGFFRTSRDGNYLIANRALARIYGYDSPEQLTTELTDIGRSLYVAPERRNEFQALIAKDRSVRDFVSQIRRRDGSIIWIAENARTVTDDDGQFLFYEGTVHDITVQRESEEATLAALKETQEAARAKAAFLAAMSHELKTPLNAVIGFSEIMKDELFGPLGSSRYRSYATDVYDNGRRLLAVINDILDLSRIESSMMEIEDEPIYVADAVASARDAAVENNTEAAPIVIDMPRNLPMLKADPKRMQQILVHLLSNAMKFTPADGDIKVRASFGSHGGLAITIEDNGIGMEPERIALALEPFKQLDNRLARRFEGVGLGLPLANALLRLHEARLTIESMPGKGTTVTIAFPPERSITQVRAASA